MLIINDLENNSGAYPIGTIVSHKKHMHYGYGVIVNTIITNPEALEEEDSIAIVLWHGDENNDLVEVPQIHKYSELKILNTVVGFA